MFRLELLENIFSLLFLSSADFAPQTPKDSSLNSNTGSTIHPVCLSDAGNTISEESSGAKEGESGGAAGKTHSSYLDLGHFIQGCRGFLVDLRAMEGFLKLLKEGLEGICVVGQQEGQEAGRALSREAVVAESIGCSVTADTFGARLQRLSKRTAEAQWRLQIVTSNQGSGSGETNKVKSVLTGTLILHFILMVCFGMTHNSTL